MGDIIQTLFRHVINFYLNLFTRYRYSNNFEHRTADDVFDGFEPKNHRSDDIRRKYYDFINNVGDNFFKFLKFSKKNESYINYRQSNFNKFYGHVSEARSSFGRFRRAVSNDNTILYWKKGIVFFKNFFLLKGYINTIIYSIYSFKIFNFISIEDIHFFFCSFNWIKWFLIFVVVFNLCIIIYHYYYRKTLWIPSISIVIILYIILHSFTRYLYYYGINVRNTKLLFTPSKHHPTYILWEHKKWKLLKKTWRVERDGFWGWAIPFLGFYILYQVFDIIYACYKTDNKFYAILVSPFLFMGVQLFWDPDWKVFFIGFAYFIFCIFVTLFNSFARRVYIFKFDIDYFEMIILVFNLLLVVLVILLWYPDGWIWWQTLYAWFASVYGIPIGILWSIVKPWWAESPVEKWFEYFHFRYPKYTTTKVSRSFFFRDYMYRYVGSFESYFKAKSNAEHASNFFTNQKPILFWILNKFKKNYISRTLIKIWNFFKKK